MAISARTQSSWAPRLNQTMAELEIAAQEVLQTGKDGKMQDLIAKLEPLKLALAQYENALWQAGARRK
jgi:hypothetical protein